MAWYQYQQENVFINNGKTLAALCAFRTSHHLHVGKSKLRYEIRAGRKGTGRMLAGEMCVFLCSSQERAIKRIAERVGGIEYMDADNISKFIAAGYIPDPYER